jgi:hypothetical protein
MAAEVLHGFTEDEKTYYRLLSEQKYEMDHYNLMADAEERGIQIGEERGIQIGEERGIQIGEERSEKKIRAEREKANARLKKSDAELKKAQTERDALLSALKASGVSDEIIRNAYRNIGS